MLVTVDFTPDEEQHLAQLMGASKAPDLGALVKAAVLAYQPPAAEPAAEPHATTDHPGGDAA